VNSPLAIFSSWLLSRNEEGETRAFSTDALTRGYSQGVTPCGMNYELPALSESPKRRIISAEELQQKQGALRCTAPSISTIRWSDAMPFVMPLASGITLSYLGNCFGSAELAGLTIGIILSIVIHRRPRLLVSTLGVIVVLVVAALCQNAYRGTHRWVVLGDLRFNVVLPLMGLGVAGVAGFKSHTVTSVARLCCCAGLVLTKSFTLSALFLVSTLPPRNCFKRSVYRSVLLISSIVLVSAILMNTNRRARLMQFISSSCYHSKQIRRVVVKLEWAGPSDALKVHLPAARTDLALLHLARRFGLIVVILHLCSFVPLLCLHLRGSFEDNPACRLILLSLAGHIAVCISILPTIGMPAPFIGAGGTQWMTFSMLLSALFLDTTHNSEGSKSQ